jgi:hypothetical protein
MLLGLFGFRARAIALFEHKAGDRVTPGVRAESVLLHNGERV